MKGENVALAVALVSSAWALVRAQDKSFKSMWPLFLFPSLSHIRRATFALLIEKEDKNHHALERRPSAIDPNGDLGLQESGSSTWASVFLSRGQRYLQVLLS